MSANLGYEVTPTLFQGNWEDPLSELNKFLETDSVLGGQKIEGIVAKCYTKFLPDGKPMMGKLVSQAFKEKHSTEWKKSNPGTKDVIQNIIDMYKVEARWRKAIQHLREQGLLVDGPQDIGPLLKEVAADVYKEEADAIKELLFKNAWPQISRGIGGGLPDWYKNVYLLEDK
jgi:hypothetical protein